MKNLLTGAAQPVTDINERIRKLFENRPMNTPAPPERQNRVRKSFTKAAAEEEAQDDDAPEIEAPDEEEVEVGSLEEDEPTSTGEDAEDE